MNHRIVDKLNEIHAILAKSELDAKVYKKVSSILVDVKLELSGFGLESIILAENCEHRQHDHCDCLGLYCMAGKSKIE